MLVTGLDVGIKNLGLCLCEVTASSFEVVAIDKIDITVYEHNVVNEIECTLHHTRETWDWVAHLIQEHPKYFNKSVSRIVVERQPLCGLVGVQASLFGQLRHKVLLTSPNRLHKFFQMKGTYEQRKVISENLGLQILNLRPSQYLLSKFKALTRKHDVSDALLLSYHHWMTCIQPQLKIENKLVKSPYFANLTDADKFELVEGHKSSIYHRKLNRIHGK